MSYETSYDTGFKPFIHDKQRGKWSYPTDFLFACIGHAIRADSLLYLPMMVFRQLGFYSIIPYVLIMAVCAIPIVFMQSFMGQFSGTGFISVFRIAPLFKGIGFVSLGLNLVVLTCYSTFGGTQLFQLLHTLQPTIPWSCEGAKEWMVLADNSSSICSRNETLKDHTTEIEIPSAEYFRTHLNIGQKHEQVQFSWLLMVCTFLVWIVVLLVNLKPVETMGRLIRYFCFVIIGIMSLIFVRCLFLPHALVGLTEFFKPFSSGQIDAWVSLPWVALSILGPGWGSILTMSSFNNFKTNIYSYSWIMAFAQLGLMLGMTFISMMLWSFLLQPKELLDLVIVHYYYQHNPELMVIPTGLTLLEVPHFWSVIYFLMLLLGSLSLMVVQLLSVLTSVFDEFESLRARKRDITIGTVGCLAVFSIYFSSNHGIDFMEFLAKSSLMTQMLLNLLLILVVLWVYGRERFQRDVDFMISHLYSRFMTTIVRFLTPLFLLLCLFIGIFIGVDHMIVEGYTSLMVLIGAAVTIIPWCLIPWYCIFRLLQTSGVIGQRFRRCVRPTDWYPADPLYKQRYEETFSNPESSHQLTIATEE